MNLFIAFHSPFRAGAVYEMGLLVLVFDMLQVRNSSTFMELIAPKPFQPGA